MTASCDTVRIITNQIIKVNSGFLSQMIGQISEHGSVCIEYVQSETSYIPHSVLPFEEQCKAFFDSDEAEFFNQIEAVGSNPNEIKLLLPDCGGYLHDIYTNLVDSRKLYYYDLNELSKFANLIKAVMKLINLCLPSTESSTCDPIINDIVANIKHKNPLFFEKTKATIDNIVESCFSFPLLLETSVESANLTLFNEFCPNLIQTVEKSISNQIQAVSEHPNFYEVMSLLPKCSGDLFDLFYKFVDTDQSYFNKLNDLSKFSNSSRKINYLICLFLLVHITTGKK